MRPYETNGWFHIRNQQKSTENLHMLNCHRFYPTFLSEASKLTRLHQKKRYCHLKNFAMTRAMWLAHFRIAICGGETTLYQVLHMDNLRGFLQCKVPFCS